MINNGNREHLHRTSHMLHVTVANDTHHSSCCYISKHSFNENLLGALMSLQVVIYMLYNMCVLCIIYIILWKSAYWEFIEHLTWWDINMRFFYFSPISVFKLALSNYLLMSVSENLCIFWIWNLSPYYNSELHFRSANPRARRLLIWIQEPPSISSGFLCLSLTL